MFDWLFGTAKVTNTYSRNIYVTSTRRPTQVFTVYGDTEVCVIQAMKIVARQLPKPEKGELVEIKAYLTPNGKPDA